MKKNRKRNPIDQTSQENNKIRKQSKSQNEMAGLSPNISSIIVYKSILLKKYWI